jgi:hypothetical protein
MGSAEASGKNDAAPQKPPQSDAPEPAGPPEQESDGARTQFGLVVVGLILAAVLWAHRGTPSATPAPALESGAIVDAPVTLVTADRDELACAMPDAIEQHVCGWVGPDTRREPLPAPERVLAPYLTTSGQIFLIGGLFEQPAVSQRYERENPAGRKREELRRFTASCKLKLLGEVDARVQFSPGSPWGELQKVWAASPVQCVIAHP